MYHIIRLWYNTKKKLYMLKHLNMRGYWKVQLYQEGDLKTKKILVWWFHQTFKNGLGKELFSTSHSPIYTWCRNSNIINFWELTKTVSYLQTKQHEIIPGWYWWWQISSNILELFTLLSINVILFFYAKRIVNDTLHNERKS